ncbi:probable cardiolipin synthase (CMP-forming) isoform X2 [Penaeus chinensis]|uniref:probable cardiolipin synthase (CMP-forming) isoform X2 n=1 Tax=Penaeus chinensis TaxID=139456 RepID=UPI001FB62594|nr:probable cardiolipin synthase (CMP-forming) isoform X2 [Penaeus chinensis]
MAAYMTSSALAKTILQNERYAHSLLRHNIQRNIQQRRKTRATFPASLPALSCLHPSQKDVRSLSWREYHSWREPRNILSKALFGRSFLSPLRLGHQFLSHEAREGVSLWRNACIKHPCQVRCLQTGDASREAGEAREQSPPVATWEAVREKKNQFKEAGQDLLDDIKEKKAKVKERMDAIIERENIWTIPNLLCVSRIAFSPYLCHLVLSADYNWALGLFMFAGFTDLLDGWIARTFPSQASRLGSFLDPLADKVLVAMLFLSLTYVGLIPLPLTGLIIYRDVLIIGGASYVRYKSLPPPKTISRYFDATHATAQLAPTTISKVNTAIQLGLITASLAAPVFSFTDHYLLTALCWVTAGTTLSSGISYIFSRNTYKILEKMKEDSKQ